MFGTLTLWCLISVKKKCKTAVTHTVVNNINTNDLQKYNHHLHVYSDSTTHTKL